MTIRTLSGRYLLFSVSCCLYLVALLLFTTLPSWAGTITLTIENRTSVTGQQVDSEFRIINKGTDTAWNVSLQATLLEQNQRVQLPQALSPGTSQVVRLAFELPPNATGDFPIYSTVAYQDASGKISSIAVLAVAHTADAVPPELTMQVIHIREPQEPSLQVNLSTTIATPLQVTLTCHIPGDLTVIPRTQQVLVHNRATNVQFQVINQTGAPGSRYGVFIIAEYNDDDTHVLVSQSVTLAADILPAGKQDAILQFRPMGIVGALLIIIGGILMVFSRLRMRDQTSWREKWPQLILDILVLVIVELFILSKLTPQYLLTPTITTGGDTASHYYTAEYLRHVLLPQGKISGWMPGNYAGFPILQLYFPLPFLIMCLLNVLMPLQIAFKWVTLLGVFLLPVGMYSMLRSLRSPFPGPAIGAAFTLPFLFNGANSMWGGNILSTLAGEFTYSLSLSLTLIFLGSLYRGCTENRYIIRNAVLVFLVGFSHGYTLLFAEAVSLFFLITPRGFIKRVVYLLKVYILGFLFLAFWLVPLILRSKYTITFHMAWVINSLQEIIPEILLPVILLAFIGSISLLLWYVRLYKSKDQQWRADVSKSSLLSVLGFLWFGILIAVIMFVAAPQLGVIDIRYVPCGQLMACALAAFGLGWLGTWLNRWKTSWVYLLLIVGATLFWTHGRVGPVPDWTKWNYEGFETKPAWPLFQRITASLRGSFQDPRVLYEHSVHNNGFGSVRAFESLPLFSGRATLEGLYLQASLSAPFVFYIQSETSKEISCPFKQYYCTYMDLNRARRHLEMFNVRELILRSKEAKTAIRTYPEYQLRQMLGDYEIWELRGYQYRYVVPLQYEPVLYSNRDWKNVAYQWFDRNETLVPHLVFVPDPSRESSHLFKTSATSLEQLEVIPIDTDACRIKERIRNDEILIETNCINKPLLIKMSYHPNWHVEGAEKIYLISPSFMLIFPQQEHVRLYYGPGLPELIGRLLTGIGLIILVLNIPLPGKDKHTSWTIIANRFGIPPSLEPRLKWDPSPARRYGIMAGGLCLSFIIIVWANYRIYTDDPNRWFNNGVKLRDTKHFEEAREEFRRVIMRESPVSGLVADARYFIGICYYLEDDNAAAIIAFEEFVEQYPHGSRLPEVYYHIGLCYLRMGQTDQGITQLRFLMEQFPGAIWAEYAKDRLQEHDAL